MRYRLGWRVRAFLVLIALRSFGYAYAYVVSADRLGEQSTTFRIVEELLPLEGWAIVFFGMGLVSIAGAIRPRELGVRMVASISVGLNLLFGLGLLFAGTTSPGVVSFFALAGKDALFASMPYARLRLEDDLP